jgi:hypothetical protein
LEEASPPVIEEPTIREEELTIDIDMLTTIIEQQKEEIARLKAAPKTRSGAGAPAAHSSVERAPAGGEGQPLVGSPHVFPRHTDDKQKED